MTVKITLATMDEANKGRSYWVMIANAKGEDACLYQTKTLENAQHEYKFWCDFFGVSQES